MTETQTEKALKSGINRLEGELLLAEAAHRSTLSTLQQERDYSAEIERGRAELERKRHERAEHDRLTLVARIVELEKQASTLQLALLDLRLHVSGGRP